MTPALVAGQARMPDDARETRGRLLDTAARLFAERGFDKVGVREICAEAQANVAAVNYYFGDKLALYRAVVALALATMRETSELSMEAGRGEAPETQLRAYVRVFLARVAGSDHASWIHKLVAREMEQPTSALGSVMRDIVVPRHEYVADVVCRLSGIPASDPRVLRAVASIQGQLLVFVRPLPPGLPEEWRAMKADLDGTVEHIVRFSLAGIRAL